jgi:CTP synthase
MATKYIFITGGVCSSLGKGVTLASIGSLLEGRGYSVALQKMDPYINVDPGTMSPYQHGEVYVTEDGAETDLDLGYYERFTSSHLSKKNSVSTGQIYHTVIQRERRGDYLGRTVQVVPHITNEIKSRIWELSRQNPVDFVLVEIGGTVGDIESIPFIEAIRQYKHDNSGSVLVIHLTLVPVITAAGEAKTKPTQHSVKEVLSLGIQPDILVCRVKEPLSKELKAKISMFTNVSEENVISAHDIKSTIYEIPIMYQEEKMDLAILKHFKITPRRLKPSPWKKIVKVINDAQREVTVALAGKYVSLQDAYRSIYEALIHGGVANNCRVKFKRIDTENLKPNLIKNELKDATGILVPGGFGVRGTEGKISIIKYARENKIPFLGICLGMQAAVIEFARNILGWNDAHSTEFDNETKHPVISLLEEQMDVDQMGATQRLGAYRCRLNKNSLVYKLYKKQDIFERHRHRFEFTRRYVQKFEKAGLKISGVNPSSDLVEIVELPGHPFFIGCQFHPEFRSKPNKAHPLFKGFINAVMERKYSKKRASR